MLISRRKEGETLLLGGDIELRIVSIRRKKVLLGIIAPRDVRITTTRLTDAEMANTMAAANSVDIDAFLHATSEEEQVVFLLEESRDRSKTADKKSGIPE